MATKPGIVHIVHHVDAEGPLHEPAPETIERVERTFGITIDAPKSEETLKEVQKGNLVGSDPAIIAGVKRMLDPHMTRIHATWEEIDPMLKRILSREYRNALLDSYSGGWVYNWHAVDQAGFVTNARSKDLGYLTIFNHYEKILADTQSTQDAIHWHFHPIPFFREAHISATSYENSYPDLHQILCRRIIEKHWFPRVNRAGFHTERPDSNWFLEQWIPFDASNQSMATTSEIQTDAINGRFGDWRGAPDNWSVYHPDLYDWRKPGNLNRVIARVLNMRARFRTITVAEIEKAFTEARKGGNVYLGITNHDFRDMESEIDEFRKNLQEVASRYPDVTFKFSEALEAFRAVLGYSETEVTNNALDFTVALDGNTLVVESVRGAFFGPQPYLALKTKQGAYFHDNFDFSSPSEGKKYFYTFDRNTIPLEDIETIAVASNDKYGTSVVKTLTPYTILSL